MVDNKVNISIERYECAVFMQMVETCDFGNGSWVGWFKND